MASFTVYLMRHGQAEGMHPSGDRARALTPEGRSQVTALGQTLKGTVSITRVVCSPYVRARQTADVMADVLGLSVREETVLASGLSAGVEVLALARTLGQGVLLVGHNPEMADALARVSGKGTGVPPGMMAAVQWDDHGVASVLWTRL